MALTIGIFAATYLAMALGRLPGFRVDRTGAALLGAIGMLVFEKIGSDAAWASISFPTMALLFGLMIVSASFSVSGFYDRVATRAATLRLGPSALLAVMIAMSGIFSAILTNDVVVVAMVPLLVQLCQARGLNPVPFLLGFAFAANGGSAGTIIGSPQNMIVAEALHLSFIGFMKGAMVPALLSLPAIWAVMVVLYRGRWTAPAATPRSAAPVTFDKIETIKGAIVTALVVAIFCLSSWPRPLVALGAAAILLLNRRISSSNVLKQVDGDLFILLGGLMVVNAAFALTGLPQQAMGELQQWGVDLQDPLTLLLTIGVLSDIVGNNPAVLLVVPYLKSVDPELAGAAVALGTGLASNIVVFGSLAGIIVVEEAGRRGVAISAAEFSRAGGPVVLISLAIAAAWLMFLGG